MPFEEVKKVWMNGRLVDFADAKIHVFTHALHYGSGLFEGIRCYDTRNQGPAIFRLDDHIRRLYDSCRIYRMEIPYTAGRIQEGLRRHRLARMTSTTATSARVVYRGFHSLGVFPAACPVDVVVGAWHWGKYLGPEAIEQGVDVRVSSWNRMAPNTFPALAKATGNYMNSILIRQEAAADGYAEGIALDVNGYVSEGSGENVFVVRDGKIMTPPLGASILAGITRASVVTIARDLGFEVVEIVDSARVALRRRRSLLHRHRRRGHADSQHRPRAGRQRPPRTDHGAHPERVLRLHRRRHPRPLPLVHARLRRAERNAAQAGARGRLNRLT